MVVEVTEVAGRALPPLLPTAHLLEPIIERAKRHPEQVVAAVRHGDVFINVTAGEMYRRVRALAKGLVASSVQPGQRVAIMSRTRLEWLLLDYAILAAGAVTVPIYETSAAEQVRWILSDSGAVLAVVETAAMGELATGTGDDAVCEMLVIDSGGLDTLAERGRTIGDGVLEERIARIVTDDVATIIYTSGTTGRPKGCVLSHGNLRANVMQNVDAVRELLHDDERSLMFLPLAHSLAKIIALVGAEHGVVGMFATDMAKLPEELAMAEPTMIVAVPRVFEKVFNTAQQASRERHRARLFDRACDVAIRFSRQRREGRLTIWTRLERRLWDRLVYRRIRAGFGGSMRFAFSGGSPLGERLTYFFDGIGVRIFEGYGLTETGPTLTVNRPDAWRPGTVGQPIAGTALRVDSHGEVQAKGPQVFRGYWRNGGETDRAFTADGWFRTGDIGVLEDGFLRITGRQKELIVTSGGKNVAPAPMEDHLRAHPLISQAIVLGDNRPFIAALLTVDEEALTTWRLQRGEGATGGGDRVNDLDLRTELQLAVDDVNATVSRPESIRAFAILPADLSIADGELTPTMKVRRAVVESHYATVIDELYATAPSPARSGP